MLPDDEVRHLAIAAVNFLIAQAKSGVIDGNHELGQVIAVCIRDTKPRHLDTLNFLLSQYPEQTAPAVVPLDALPPR